MEIERKFLLPGLPDGVEPAASAVLRQGYLVSGPDGSVRVRDADGAFTLTTKSGSGLAREETEIAITAEQFEQLWPATEGRRVEKHRHRIPAGALTYELDVFAGSLAGLSLVEVEFSSMAEAAAFVPPEWFGPEVTDDARYTNASLARDGLPDPADGYPLS